MKSLFAYWHPVVEQNCHPDRSAAQWRDLRFLFLAV
jgi:hypothetical protein